VTPPSTETRTGEEELKETLELLLGMVWPLLVVIVPLLSGGGPAGPRLSDRWSTVDEIWEGSPEEGRGLSGSGGSLWAGE